MLDIKLIRDDPKKVKKGVAAKQYDPSLVDKVLELDEKRRKLLAEVEELRSERNKVAKEGKDFAKGKEIKSLLAIKEPELTDFEYKINEILQTIPNLPADDVPVGKSESDNKVIKSWGEPRKFDFSPKDHQELGKALGILDFEAGAKVSGSQFYFLYD